MAIVRATKATNSAWLRRGLWTAWTCLATSILFENFAPELFSEWIKYPAAFGLIGLHLYNRKYGCCDQENCIVHG